MWQNAQKGYETIVGNQSTRNDPFSYIQLGNIFVHSAKNAPEDRRFKLLKTAYDFFFTVLSKDKANLYAANGIAIALFEMGAIGTSESILVQVKKTQEFFA